MELEPCHPVCCKVHIRIPSEGNVSAYETNAFHPTFMHQLLPDDKDFDSDIPDINVYFARDFTSSCSFTDRNNESARFVEDSIVRYLPNHTKMIDQSQLTFAETNSTCPCGKFVSSFSCGEDEFVIHTGCFKDEAVSGYYSCIQVLGLMFIDACSILENDDYKWNLFFLFRKCGEGRHAFVGFSALYHLFAFPDKIRPRFGQFLILPGNQRKGLGTLFLEQILLAYRRDEIVMDIIIEDGNDEFLRLFDLVNCKFCLTMIEFSTIDGDSELTTGMIEDCNEFLKINVRFTKRVFEILKLKYHCDRPGDWTDYIDGALRRMNKQIEIENKRANKLRKWFTPKQFSRLLSDLENRRVQNEQIALEMVVVYRRVVDRLSGRC